ncbi:Thrombomodulin [Dirofilaria immitis]
MPENDMKYYNQTLSDWRNDSFDIKSSNKELCIAQIIDLALITDCRHSQSTHRPEYIGFNLISSTFLVLISMILLWLSHSSTTLPYHSLNRFAYFINNRIVPSLSNEEANDNSQQIFSPPHNSNHKIEMKCFESIQLSCDPDNWAICKCNKALTRHHIFIYTYTLEFHHSLTKY